MEKAILLFVKYPQPGRVKTRLAAEVGDEQAAAICRRLVETVCRLLPGDCAVIVCFDPADKGAEIGQWLEPLLKKRAQFLPQCAGDLGDRLARAFEQAVALGHGKIAVIGGDCVEISAATFEETWRALEAGDCVIGPSHDGGYYLLALKTAQPRLFKDIAWSSDATLRHTIERAREVGLIVHQLPQLHDVDTEMDWLRARERLISIHEDH